MKLMLKHTVATILLVFSFAASVAAGPIEDAYAAHDRGDYATALRFWRQLADRGDATGQLNLGYMYREGRGVPQDYVSAYMWYNLAAAQDDKSIEVGAKYGRDLAAQHMTSLEIAEAQKRAREWKPKQFASVPKIIAPKASPTISTGSGFFVSMDGKAITNAHVVNNCQKIRVSINEQQGTARVIGRDDNNDLAVLATDLKPIQSANWRLTVQQGEDIVVYGFPLTGVLASGGNFVVGNVTALAGLRNDSRFLQISAPVQPGNSGGPLLDRNGNVVGVVIGKLNAIKTASVTGDIPQNVNFAIKASIAAAFLDAQSVSHSDGELTSTLSTPDIAARAKALAVQVACIR
jgi:S1-C subfamily serine protease